jgi:uncharacterized protein (DUF608 family)
MNSHLSSNPSKTYQGQNLLQIALPLGGIGTGCIFLNGHGGLQDFSIRHVPNISAMPDRHLPMDSGFAILHFPELGKTRLVEGPFPPEKIYNQGLKSQGYNGGGFEGLPRFRDCTFKGAYPFGVVKLKDDSLPLDVTINGYNPFIPLDDVNSGIPCAILEYTLHNRSDQIVPYHFVYSAIHLAQKGAEIFARSEALPGLGVHFWNDAPPSAIPYGSATFGVLAGDPIIKAKLNTGHPFDGISNLWREITTNSFEPADGILPGSRPALNAASLLVKGELASDESITYPIVITWYFPNISASIFSDARLSPKFDPQTTLHPFYATQWGNALEVLNYVKENFAELREKTVAFHVAMCQSSLPPVVLEAVTANLAVLKTPTVARFDNGDLWGWEGCFVDKGCCPGSCTHVWNYAQAIPHLFPALERTLRQQEYEAAMDERGHINFRVSPPGLPTLHDYHPAADGQLGGVMKVYREWQISGDRSWLEKLYPLVKRSIDFAIAYWDPRNTGLIEEPHHNTYDIEFWGPDGLCSSMYLGALTAMALMARELGHEEDALAYEALAEKSTKALEDELFNGEYYQQKIMFEGLNDTSFLQLLESLKDDSSPRARLFRAEGPNYQFGSGCLSDGVFGAWLAELCGLQSPQNTESVRKHLESVYTYNFKPSLWEHVNPQRPGYALGDEAGLLSCTWPHGGQPTLPFIYSNEVWTGIEYQVAGHMISLGMLEEGLRLVEAVRSRYDGHVRNPWNEYECGNYYARSMASYGLLIALSGFRYAAPTRTLTIAPQLEPLPLTFFFSTASGWGSLKIEEEHVTIKLTAGELVVDTLVVKYAGKTVEVSAGVTIGAGEEVSIAL